MMITSSLPPTRWLLLLLALSTGALAQDAPKATPGKATASQDKEKAAGAPGGKAAVPGEARAAAGDDVEIPWDGGKLKGVPQIVKRLYRLKKSGQWGDDRLPKLCRLALETGNPKLKIYATWYEALVAGHQGRDDEARAKLKQAVELGYLNVVEMEESEELSRIRETEDVKALLAGLKGKLADRMVQNYKRSVEANFKAAEGAPGGKPWGESVLSVDGQPLLPKGKPSVLVLARTHHDPLEQLVPELKRLQAAVPVKLAFWSVYPTDPHEVELTKKYLASLTARLGFTAPGAAIGRKEYLDLRQVARAHFERSSKAKERAEDEDAEVFGEALPFTIVLNAEGIPVHTAFGALAPWQVDFLIEKAKGLPSLPEPPPPPKEPAPAPPAPPPAQAAPPVEPAPAPVPPKAEEPRPAEPAPAPPPKGEEPKPAEPAPAPKPASDPPPPKPAEEPGKAPAPPPPQGGTPPAPVGEKPL